MGKTVDFKTVDYKNIGINIIYFLFNGVTNKRNRYILNTGNIGFIGTNILDVFCKFIRLRSSCWKATSPQRNLS